MVIPMSESRKQFSPVVVKTLVYLTSLYLLANIMISVTNSKFENLRTFIGTAPTETQSVSDKFKQLDCLARNIYWEAATEPFEGKVAVAQVTLNRVESGKFGSDICTTVYQKNVVYERVICQFSWVCEGTHKFKPIMNQHYKESEEVAKKVYMENFRLPGLADALFYHADYVNPGWKKQKLAQIGRHIFYK